MKRKQRPTGGIDPSKVKTSGGPLISTGRKFSRVGATGSALRTGGFSANFGKSSGEKKFFDVAQASVQVNSTGLFTLAMVPVAGVGFENRIGRKTTATQIYIRGKIGIENAMGTAVAAFNTPAQQLRMILFVDMQSNGTAPTQAELLSTTGPSAQLNPNSRDRFKILKDKVWVFDPYISGGDSFNRTIASLKIFKKLPNIETIYRNSAGAGTVADIQTGAIYIFWLGDQAASANPIAGATAFISRVRYLDN